MSPSSPRRTKEFRPQATGEFIHDMHDECDIGGKLDKVKTNKSSMAIETASMRSIL